MNLEGAKENHTKRIARWSKKKTTFIVFIFAFIIGFCIGTQREKTVTVNTSFKAIREGQQKLINPLLAIDVPEGVNSEEDRDLRAKIENSIALSKSQGKVDYASVYFKGPTRGNWLGVETDKTYYPGSLLKVPVLIAYLKIAETAPDSIFKTVTYTIDRDENALENIKPSVALESGKAYTVDQLLSEMIKYSDNNAGLLLSSLIDQRFLNEVYTDLGLDIPPNRETKISPKSYSIFFRVLFNSTYLSRENSEKALELLSSTDFKDGLTAGIPEGITVAHKFGEYKSTDSSGNEFQELHDCGLVYLPKNPYFVCIMTHGKDITDLKKTIADISKTIYEANK